MLDALRKFLQYGKPEFNSLKLFPHKDQYFYRVAMWGWLTEDCIHIYDPHGPRRITLDPWPQRVFLEAKGNLTVSDYIHQLASLYKTNIPKKLDDMIIYQLNTLYREKVIEYSDTAIQLEPRFENPSATHSNP